MYESISRQHSETEIHEITGMVCNNLLAVRGSTQDTVHVLYLSVDSLWLRVFIDCGVLFLESVSEPGREDDLETGEEYRDLASELGSLGLTIGEAKMANGAFAVMFDNGLEIQFEDFQEETRFLFRP